MEQSTEAEVDPERNSVVNHAGTTACANPVKGNDSELYDSTAYKDYSVKDEIVDGSHVRVLIPPKHGH